MKWSTLILTSVLVLAAGAKSAQAAYTVAPDGSGDFPTIQAALDALSSGSEIELLPGVFAGPGNRDLMFWGRGIALRSRTGDPTTTIIDCERQGIGVWFHNYEIAASTLEGITIRNGLGRQAGAVSILMASPTFRNCVFEDNVCDPGIGGGGILAYNSGALFIDCTFARNRVSFGGGGACCGGSPAPTFRGCVFIGNRADAYPILTGGAIYCEDSSPTLEGCTIVGNATTGGCGGIMLTLSSPTIRGCTIARNSGLSAGGILSTWDSSPSLSNTVVAFNEGELGGVYCEPGLSATCCDIFGNAGGDWIGCLEDQLGVMGNISLDPLFCREAEGDYTLRADSPCAEEHNPSCGQIGALGVGCEEPTKVDRTSWGRIRHLFR